MSHKWKFILVLTLQFGLISISSAANSKYLHAICMPEIKYMEIVPLSLSGENPKGDIILKYGLHKEGKGKFSCSLRAGLTTSFEFSSTTPRGRGMCGWGTHSKLDIYANSELIFKEIVFDPSCLYSGFSYLSFEDAGGTMYVKVAMHTKMGTNSMGPRVTYRDALFISYNDAMQFSGNISSIPITMEYFDKKLTELSH